MNRIYQGKVTYGKIPKSRDGETEPLPDWPPTVRGQAMGVDPRHASEYTTMDKTIQLAARLASIPTAISGLPAAITSLNYLKQIVITKGISLRFGRLVDEIRPGVNGGR